MGAYNCKDTRIRPFNHESHAGRETEYQCQDVGRIDDGEDARGRVTLSSPQGRLIFTGALLLTTYVTCRSSYLFLLALRVCVSEFVCPCMLMPWF